MSSIEMIFAYLKRFGMAWRHLQPKGFVYFDRGLSQRMNHRKKYKKHLRDIEERFFNV